MIENYIKCRNCGTYFAQKKAVYNWYCSETCMYRYHSCIICGNYFVHNKGFNENICSRECSIEYKITKSYGNEYKALDSPIT